MDAEAYPQEVLADEEPKYLRRQKPLEIKRRKFGRKAWQRYLRVTMWAAVGLAGAWIAYDLGHFLLASPEMALIHPEQVGLTGNHYVTRRERARDFCSRSRQQRTADSARPAAQRDRGNPVGGARHGAARSAEQD